jgi:hypothetical protein
MPNRNIEANVGRKANRKPHHMVLGGVEAISLCVKSKRSVPFYYGVSNSLKVLQPLDKNLVLTMGEVLIPIRMAIPRFVVGILFACRARKCWHASNLEIKEILKEPVVLEQQTKT